MPETRKPIVAGWGITDRCNLTCPHCYSAAGKKSGSELSHEESRRIIDDMAMLGIQVIGRTGGEPLLRPDLEELVAYAARYGIWSSITTNGILLDKKRALSLTEAGIKSIQISLDGSTPERNYRMRRTTDDEFGRILDGIRICKRLNIKIYLATLLGFENLDDAQRMIELGKREGFACMRFCGFLPVGRGHRKTVQERLHFNKGLTDILAFIKKAIADDSFTVLFDPGCGPLPPNFEFHQCIAGMETFYIKPNGDVFPCTSLIFPQFRVGNLRDRSLAEIWNDPTMAAIAKYPTEKITGGCRDCDNLANCHGACRGAVVAYTGDVDASFPACLYSVHTRRMAQSAGK